MFSFFKKKKVDTENIKNFHDVVDAINVFILLSEWQKANTALLEVRDKELNSLNKLIQKIEDEDDINGEKEKEHQRKLYKKKLQKLDKLEEKLRKQETQYKDAEEKEKFKIRFKKIKDEIELLTGNKENSQAMSLLQKFLEENKENHIVIKFFNKEKKIIQRNIEKFKREENENFKKDAKLEAMRLIGQNVNLDAPAEPKKDKKKGFFIKLKDKFNFYRKLKEKIRKKRLLDEINILIDEDSKVKNDIAARKLANIHKGLIKEISNDKILGYEMYGKILGADKISGDTFGFADNKEKYNFFLGDATGHGIRAGFIVTLLSRLFNKFVANSDLKKLTFEINNGLKQDLKNRNFITGIFFELKKEDINKINFVGMGHEPMLIYRAKSKIVEKLIPGGLAAGIRLIKEKEDIKEKEILLEDKDILITYSDGITESKNDEGELYGLERLKNSFNQAASTETDINKVYEMVIHDAQTFRGGSSFLDDVSILVLKRNTDKDVVDESSKYLKDLSMKEGLKGKDMKRLEGKTKEEIETELDSIRKGKETERIVKILESYYYTGEVLKLKQEAIRFIKEGFIHKKINFYLKKAIDGEKTYKIEQKNQKIDNKYKVLSELYKKGDYSTVIQEIEDVIAKDGNI